MEKRAGFVGEKRWEKTECSWHVLISALCALVHTFHEDIHPLSVLISPHNSLIGVVPHFQLSTLTELSPSQGEYFTFLLNTSRKGTWIWDGHRGAGLAVVSLCLLNSVTFKKKKEEENTWKVSNAHFWLQHCFFGQQLRENNNLFGCSVGFTSPYPRF